MPTTNTQPTKQSLFSHIGGLYAMGWKNSEESVENSNLLIRVMNQ